ncbi:transcriptional regulator GcvA [Paremcibacter congregatus]|uniref:transcriptional regulator GcvA n=1 Tax=Paremcibacter congregatus TaxID=2043170 RepID=UPI003A95B3F4
MHKLPPLAGFKAFEAAARFQSFTKAAEELNVTQAAVSQQIKQLEYYLGFDLFSRRPRQIALTEKGAALAHTVREALEDIGEKIARLQSNAHEETLRITVVPSFAMLWLIPRIADFSACHPNIDLRIDTSEEYIDLAKDGYDLAIRITNVPNPNLDCQLLSKGLAVPVYSPKLLKDGKAWLGYDDLRCFTLLHRRDTELWRQWLRHQGLLSENCNFGSSYNRAGPLVAAAIAGQGVAMVPAMLASFEIKQGNLLVLDPVGIETDNNTYLMGLKDTVDKPAIVAFRKWMMQQMVMSRSHFTSDAGLSRI